jgi:hypothetical protein
MQFQRGNRLADKRKNRRGGRPTKEEAEKKQVEAETAKEIIEQNAAKLANKLINDAMTAKGRRSLHKAIDKLVPDAKQTVVIEGDGLLEKAIRIAEERRRGRNG